MILSILFGILLFSSGPGCYNLHATTRHGRRSCGVWRLGISVDGVSSQVYHLSILGLRRQLLDEWKELTGIHPACQWNQSHCHNYWTVTNFLKRSLLRVPGVLDHDPSRTYQPQMSLVMALPPLTPKDWSWSETLQDPKADKRASPRCFPWEKGLA